MTRNRPQGPRSPSPAQGGGRLTTAEDVIPPGPPDPLAAFREPEPTDDRGTLPDLSGSGEPEPVLDPMWGRLRDAITQDGGHPGVLAREVWDEATGAAPQVPGTVPLVTQEDQENAVGLAVVAMHNDMTCLGFLHKGSVCGCAYIARFIVHTVLPAQAVVDADPEASED